ncbi:MAG TPA: glycoside hydrolase domain-containing protein [Polyangiaceae bacterium]|jgi:hypothetical protein
MKRLVPVACLMGLAALATPVHADSSRARVVVLDDGVRILEDEARPLEPSPWPAGPIDLFALRGEILAIQVVIEAGDAPVLDARVLFEPLRDDAGARLDLDVTPFVERFLYVERPSGNEREPGSLAFTPKASLGRAFTGAIADPLVPAQYERASAPPHQRTAVWLDLSVPLAAAPGTYRGELLVRDRPAGELASRAVVLHVLDATLPYAAAPTFVYYEAEELERRMGDREAETSLRHLFHAHHLSTVHPLDGKSERDPRALLFERDAYSGEAYTPARGYRGPGEGVGEGVLAIGTYGILGEPSVAGRDVAARLAKTILGSDPKVAERTQSFLYSIDETCGSDWPARWLPLVHASEALKGFRVGATCGNDPAAQAADLVMQTAGDWDPGRVRVANERGKWVWAYNGCRPWAGSMVEDVPATDLRANSWIALRYGIPRWFYWEATFWFDNNRGGRGGQSGFDPFVVSETFHNSDGDYSNGDGLLVYPGTQRTEGMVDYGAREVFPSVRLKNLRRGIEDAGYAVLARRVDRQAADAVIRRIIPHAVVRAADRPSWPQQARPWLDARRELADILVRGRRGPRGEEQPSGTDVNDGQGEPVSESCSSARFGGRGSSAAPSRALFLMSLLVWLARVRRRSTSRAGAESE